MSFGLGVLRLAPRDFWQMTPRELAAAARHLADRAPELLTRGGLEALMRAYPDKEKDDG
jgi:uncharacterized phage protein (TIGR02216 family)